MANIRGLAVLAMIIVGATLMLTGCGASTPFDQVREAVAMDELLAEYFAQEPRIIGESEFSPFNHVTVFSRLQNRLKEQRLKRDLYNQYWEQLSAEVTFVRVRVAQKKAWEEKSYMDASSLARLLADLKTADYDEVLALETNSERRAYNLNLSNASYPYIGAYVDQKFREEQLEIMGHIDHNFSNLMTDDPFGSFFKKRLEYRGELLQGYQALVSELQYTLEEETQAKLGRYEQLLVHAASFQEQKPGEDSRYKAKEEAYVAEVVSYMTRIGREVTIINQELNNFTASDRLPNALQDLIRLSNYLRRLSSPSPRFDGVEEWVEEGALLYIKSAESIALAVLRFDANLIDRGVAESKEAGIYFKYALELMAELGYNVR